MTEFVALFHSHPVITSLVLAAIWNSTFLGLVHACKFPSN